MIRKLLCLWGWHRWYIHRSAGSTGFPFHYPGTLFLGLPLILAGITGASSTVMWLSLLPLLLGIWLLPRAVRWDWHGHFDGTCIHCHTHIRLVQPVEDRRRQKEKLEAKAMLAYQKEFEDEDAQ